MSQFPLFDDNEVTDPLVCSVFDEVRTELGFGIVPNLFKSMATSPQFLAGQWHQFRTTVLQGQLPRTLKEMIGVVISQANQSEYALKVHLHSLSALGISEEVLRLLVADFEHCPLPSRQKAAIRFGLQCAVQPQTLTAAEFTQLRQVGMTDVEIFEIIATANLFLGVNHYTDAIALEIDQL
ncbi:MAG: carboxymuconolactone decarboxylase family protein [Caldilineaceae bacterium]|nr:carboxymuconolactone decarboxylase family protein [Caldilineaceae bacterium]